MDQDDLKSGDAVVISYPFADTGGKHGEMDRVLSQCEAMDIPVLLDCAYMGICSGLDINLTWSCITDVTFSMSKSFPLSHARIGMRVTRHDDDDPLFVLNKTNYTNRLGAYLGRELLQAFGPDYIPIRYRDRQHQWCRQLGATASATVIFGLGDQHWKDYDRGAGNHRLCFNKYLASGQLPNGH
jgi:histidinol-phosphate/aromatic aminotransferase/cobyric acid decarboxylase-like protein